MYVCCNARLCKLFYKDVVLPTHTKPVFKDYSILTVRGITPNNGLIFLSKKVRFSSTLSKSILELLMPTNSPATVLIATHEPTTDWSVLATNAPTTDWSVLATNAPTIDWSVLVTHASW